MIGPAFAAEPVGQSHPCANTVDPTERLACYDAAFPPGPDILSGAASLEAERKKALEEFGLNRMQLRSQDPERAREIEHDRIEATVARVGQRATGERVITLDNDQVWLLTEATSKGHLSAGDRVVIREAALGSYKLMTPGRVPLRARRIR